MNLDNEGHQIYLWKLLGRLKFHEFDEYDFRQFVQSPFGTEILKELMTHSTNKFIPKDIGQVDSKLTDLILKRVDNWEESSKEAGRQWSDLQIRDYLISMIEPFKYTDDLILKLTADFKERVKSE